MDSGQSKFDFARWMESYHPYLVDIPLRQICLPGTHDSGAYTLSSQVVPGNTIPDWLCQILNSRWLSCCSNAVWSMGVGWSVTQEGDLGVQIARGVRYFDLRVAKVDHSFHLVHTFLGPPLEPQLRKVGEFLAVHPAEVVLLDFNHLYGLTTPQDHIALHSLIEEHLGPLMAARNVGLDVTYGDLIRTRKQVICFCVDAVSESGSPSLLPPLFWHHTREVIHTPWPNVTSLGALRTKLSRIIENSRKEKSFFILQGILTPTSETFQQGLIQSPGNLRTFSCPAHALIQEFLTDPQLKPRGVIMVDFISDELIMSIINANRDSKIDGDVGRSRTLNPVTPQTWFEVVHRLTGLPSLYVLFTSDDDPQTGKPWCPDCERANEVIAREVEKAGGTLLVCQVGDRANWKSGDHPLRSDPKVKLTSIPTLLQWKGDMSVTNRRLDGELEKYKFVEDVERSVRGFLSSSS